TPRDDPALPGLARIFALGPAAIVPALAGDDADSKSSDNEERRSEVLLRAHKPGRHATLEVRTPKRHFAVLIDAKEQEAETEAEAELYEALAGQGLADGPGARVPRLLARHPEGQLLAVEWLDGPTLTDLIKRGDGRRAGELAADWIGRAAALPLTQGRP